MSRKTSKTLRPLTQALWNFVEDPSGPEADRRDALELLLKLIGTEAPRATTKGKPKGKARPSKVKQPRTGAESVQSSGVAAPAPEVTAAPEESVASVKQPQTPPVRRRAPSVRRKAPVEAAPQTPPQAVAPLVRKRAQVEAREADKPAVGAVVAAEPAFEAMLREAREKSSPTWPS